MIKIQEMYLLCMGCKRVPEWTKITATKNEQGFVVKHYEFEGMCPYCKGGNFEVVNVTSLPAEDNFVREEQNQIGHGG